jgi:hypothetical protein
MSAANPNNHGAAAGNMLSRAASALGFAPLIPTYGLPLGFAPLVPTYGWPRTPVNQPFPCAGVPKADGGAPGNALYTADSVAFRLRSI